MKKAIVKVLEGEKVVEEVVGGLKEVLEDEVVLVLSEGGEAHFQKEDVLVEMTDEVFVLSKGEEKVEVKKVKKEKVEGELKALKEGSKLAQVVAICKANPTATRKELIALIVEQVGMTAAGASTYHQNAKPYLV